MPKHPRLKDREGRIICSSAGLPICTPCGPRNPTPPGACCMSYATPDGGFCFVLKQTGGAFNVLGGVPLVMNGRFFVPVGDARKQTISCGFQITGVTTVGGKTICFTSQIALAIACHNCIAGPLDCVPDETKIEFIAKAGPPDWIIDLLTGTDPGPPKRWPVIQCVSGPTPNVFASISEGLLSLWQLPIPPRQFVLNLDGVADLLSTTTWNCTGALVTDLPWSVTFELYDLLNATTIGTVTNTYLLSVYANAGGAPCMVPGGRAPDSIVIVDDPASSDGGLQYGVFPIGYFAQTPAVECPCDFTIPTDPPICPPMCLPIYPPLDPPPETIPCCSGSFPFGTEPFHVSGQMSGLDNGSGINPNCVDCANVPLDWYYFEETSGGVTSQGFVTLGIACGKVFVVRILCSDGGGWSVEFYWDGVFYSDAELLTAPCSFGFANSYAAVSLNLGPGHPCVGSVLLEMGTP